MSKKKDIMTKVNRCEKSDICSSHIITLKIGTLK